MSIYYEQQDHDARSYGEVEQQLSCFIAELLREFTSPDRASTATMLPDCAPPPLTDLTNCLSNNTEVRVVADNHRSHATEKKGNGDVNNDTCLGAASSHRRRPDQRQQKGQRRRRKTRRKAKRLSKHDSCSPSYSSPTLSSGYLSDKRWKSNPSSSRREELQHEQQPRYGHGNFQELTSPRDNSSIVGSCQSQTSTEKGIPYMPPPRPLATDPSSVDRAVTTGSLVSRWESCPNFHQLANNSPSRTNTHDAYSKNKNATMTARNSRDRTPFVPPKTGGPHETLLAADDVSSLTSTIMKTPPMMNHFRRCSSDNELTASALRPPKLPCRSSTSLSFRSDPSITTHNDKSSCSASEGSKLPCSSFSEDNVASTRTMSLMEVMRPSSYRMSCGGSNSSLFSSATATTENTPRRSSPTPLPSPSQNHPATTGLSSRDLYYQNIPKRMYVNSLTDVQRIIQNALEEIQLSQPSVSSENTPLDCYWSEQEDDEDLLLVDSDSDDSNEDEDDSDSYLNSSGDDTDLQDFSLFDDDDDDGDDDDKNPQRHFCDNKANKVDSV